MTESLDLRGVAERLPRFPQLLLETMTSPQRELAQKILKTTRVGLAGPHNPLLRSPEMYGRLYWLMDYLRFNTSVPLRLNEFAILIQARLWTSQVEWFAHYPLAIAAGLPEEVAADLKAGRRPAAMQEDEALVYDLCMEISTGRRVSDDTFAKAKSLLGEQQLIDIVVTSGLFNTIAMVLSLAEATVPEGHAEPLPALA